jgi:hypothetical protein
MRGSALAKVIAGLVALLAAVIVGRAAYLHARGLMATVPVVTARTSIPAYALITADMLETSYLPRASITQPTFAEPAEVIGRLGRVDLPAGAPVWQTDALPAEELRYTDDRQAVILRLAFDPARAPADLLHPGQRVDVWRGDRLLARDLRLVTVERLPDGRVAVDLECPQELVPALLAAVGDPTLALTLSPLARLPTPAPGPTATATHVLAARTAPTRTPSPTATPTPTPRVAIVRPGPAQGLNVRAGAGREYPVIAVLPGGSQLTPLGRDFHGRWLLVCCTEDGAPGWVLVELVDLEGDLAALPVVTPQVE